MKRFILAITLIMLNVVVMCAKTTKTNFVTHITLTTYNPTKSQCDSTPLLTADGTKINLKKLKNKEIKYCAVARNLLPFIPYGSIIHIEGKGVYEVHDTMNKRFSHYIDILQHHTEGNYKLTNVKVTLLKKGDGKYRQS